MSEISSCGACGSPVNGAPFCTICGTRQPALTTAPPAAVALASEADAASTPADNRKKRRLRLGARTVAVLSLLAIGAGTSYLIAPPTTEQKIQVVDPEQLAVQEAGSMPGLLGMNIDAARVALADAGITSTNIALIRVPAAGAADQVLAQDPASGLGVQGTIFLTISESVPTPNVIGKPFAEATATIEKLGGAVRLEQVIAPERAAGTVLRSTPATGKSLPAVTVLQVSNVGEQVPLDSLEQVAGENCSAQGQTTIGGVEVSTSFDCSVGTDENSTMTYDTNGVAKALRFTLGVGEDSDDLPTTATVKVFLDDKLTKTVGVPRSGPATEVVVPLGAAAQVRFEITGTYPEDSYGASVMLGDAAFSVLPDDVDLLTGNL